MGNWKKVLVQALGIGVGIGIGIAVCVSLMHWWNHRPKPWTETAFTASPGDLACRLTGDNKLEFEFNYAITNHTQEPYIVPGTTSAALLRKDPENHALVKLDDVSWDDSIDIPPGQTFNVKFTVRFKLDDYNTSRQELETYGPGEPHDVWPKVYGKFVNKRMSEMDGLEFFDYVNHIRILLPRHWDLKKSDS